MSVTLIIPGQPFAKQRPRFSRETGRAYTPGKTLKFEALIRDYGLRKFARPMTGPVKVSIFAQFQMAKSWSKKKKAAHAGCLHSQKPDQDNIQKAILDGLNRVAFVDDSQVGWGEVVKVWSFDDPFTAINVAPCSGVVSRPLWLQRFEEAQP